MIGVVAVVLGCAVQYPGPPRACDGPPAVGVGADNSSRAEPGTGSIAPVCGSASVAPGPTTPTEPIEVPGTAATAPNRRVRGTASVDDGFALETTDGRFRASVGFLGWLRYAVVSDAEGADHGFTLPAARVVLAAELWNRRVNLFFQPEFAGSTRLLDAIATVNLHPAFAIALGQQRPMLTRGFTTILPLLAFPDRGEVVDEFRVDRDLGVTFQGRPFDGRMEYFVGVFNGEGPNTLENTNPHVLLTARVVGAPLGAVRYDQTTVGRDFRRRGVRFAFAAQASTNETRLTVVSEDPDTGDAIEDLQDRREIIVGGDLALEAGRVVGVAEGVWRRRTQVSATAGGWGTYGLVSVLAVPERLDVVVRAGAVQLEEQQDLRVPVEAGLNVYLYGNHAKLQLRYKYGAVPDCRACEDHTATVQGQLWF